jgi:endo-1,4-beta-D-glucanase Y
LNILIGYTKPLSLRPLLTGVLLFIATGMIMKAQEPAYPFPHHTVYNQHVIKPSKQNQTGMDNVVTAFYDQWKRAYVRNNCPDTLQYYIWDDEEGRTGNATQSVCVSEGQGYGMLIIVIMAGYDANAQKVFDGMYKFYRQHHSIKSDYLMSWSVLKDCITNSRKENNSSATDGDFDIALSLLMAGRQWGDKGKIRYYEEAVKILKAILRYEINHKSNTILLGDANTADDFDYDDIRSSDFMPAHLTTFNKYLPDKLWSKVRIKMYEIVRQIQKQFSPKTGLVPDFIVFRDGEFRPAKANYLESKYDGDYYFNACRLPMRVALDKILYGNTKANTLLDQFNEWIQDKTGNNIDNIKWGYHLDGQTVDKEGETIPSFVCPMAVSAMIDPENQEWLNDLWNYITKEFEFKDYRYYDNTLQMLSLLILSGNYWQP